MVISRFRRVARKQSAPAATPTAAPAITMNTMASMPSPVFGSAVFPTGVSVVGGVLTVGGVVTVGGVS